MGLFDCVAKRNSGLDFLGFDFTYGYNHSQNNASKPTSFEPFYNYFENDARFNYTAGTGIFQRITGEHEEPAVGIGLGHPLSLTNGSMRVNFTNSNNASVQWGAGLSRDIPVPYQHPNGAYAPPYYDMEQESIPPMNLFGQEYFCDFCVHRNNDGELVVTHSVADPEDGTTYRKEVKYFDNTNSDLSNASSERYDLDTNTGGYEWIEFRAVGERMGLYIGHSGSTDLVTEFDAGEEKESYFKPIGQTCWTLHPVLFVGGTGTNSLTLEGFSGLNITDYDSRELHHGGWYESMSLLSDDPPHEEVTRGLANCKEVDLRAVPNDPDNDTIYTQTGINASNMVDYKPAMILLPNSTYFLTENAGCDDLFGFAGRSLVNVGAYGGTNGTSLTFSSDQAPAQSSVQSIFVRLNGFGQQVLNARTGNKSTILSHLPTADSRAITGQSGRFFYEPNRDVWLDLNNSYEISTSDFSLDFVYSNEQYAKILQGQSIVVLYFREKPS